MAFNLLSEPIRRYIHDQGWEELRPIQNAAIFKILTTSENYILAARTASGKTEAAFLPILSRTDFEESGVQVLYISPLKALINDQFGRVEDLCKYLDVVITKWHGEAKRSAKLHLLKNPSGIVLITPESIEAMFVNRPYEVKHLFSNLKFVVIDEIHSFIATDRGVQLMSLLSRLQLVCANEIRVIGLSATIGDYTAAKRFTGSENNTKVLLDKAVKPVEATFRFFKSEGSELPTELLDDLYTETKDHKVLIFPNSRGRTEEVAVKLKKIADRVGGHANYFSHHSSVDRNVREYVEFFAKTNRRANFAIACTSTLELGIDIGTVDQVVQIDATISVSSLIQRLGRSGRQDGAKSKLSVYATNKWSLLQSIACWEIYRAGDIEPPEKFERSYDILLHQALSIVKASSGIDKEVLITKLAANHAFSDITKDSIIAIVEHLIQTGMLELLRNELIIGVDAEREVNSRDFYSVFQNEPNLRVVNAGRAIGELPFSPQIVDGSNILLAAKIWTIVHIDFKAMKIEVVRASDGKKPSFFGSGGAVHRSIREKMFHLLLSSEQVPELDEGCWDKLQELRKDFRIFDIGDPALDRPMLNKEGHLILFTFTGSRINRAIHVFLEIAGIEAKLNDRSSSFEIACSEEKFLVSWKTIVRPDAEVDEHLSRKLAANPSLAAFSKWSSFLPEHLQIELIKDRLYDFAEAGKLLGEWHLKRPAAQKL